jgi:hypothetical protein
MAGWTLVRGLAAIATAATAGSAVAQAWTPASELVGQPLQVTTAGVTNTLYLDPGGALRIITPGGNAAEGTWTVANGQLCLLVGGQRECIPYAGAFQPGTPNRLTSSCGAAEIWLLPAAGTPPSSGQASAHKR